MPRSINDMKIHFLQKLQQREEQNLTRTLPSSVGIDFCSNDYLSFATDVVLQKKIYKDLEGVPSGSTSSRLIRGNFEDLEVLESKLAAWSGRECALLFSSGYQANLAVFSSLLDENTIVFSDEFNHASMVDGIRLSKCEKVIFKHNDLADLSQKLQKTASAKNKIIAVESLYSMTGAKAPLKDLVLLSQKFEAQLIVDEAHATGVFGSGLVQRQSLESQVLLTIHCAGKALGVSGAWVACDPIIKDYLINFSRPFIYSTAVSPLIVRALQTSFEYWQRVGEERAILCLEKAANLRDRLLVFLEPQNLKGDGPILFLNLQESTEALHWAQSLCSVGLDVRAIRYPTVPLGHAGLRISLHANQAPEDLQQLLRAIKDKVLAC